jgi:hypothetical protein
MCIQRQGALEQDMKAILTVNAVNSKPRQFHVTCRRQQPHRVHGTTVPLQGAHYGAPRPALQSNHCEAEIANNVPYPTPDECKLKPVSPLKCWARNISLILDRRFARRGRLHSTYHMSP